MCPHGAAKSLIAEAIARDLIGRRGLEVSTANAGTEPDRANNPLATAALKSRGLEFSEQPRLVQEADIERADVVVGLGVAAADLPIPASRFIDWADAPDASADIDGLIALLEVRISLLIAEL